MESLQQSYLELSSEPVKFEPVSKITYVFFDEANREVLSVRGGGTLGVVVKGYGKTLTFCMEHKDIISSLKFSPDHSILAVQRTSTAVELLICKEGKLAHLHTQECRSKGAKLLGFIWSDENDFVMVNDQGIEIYQVVKEKCSVRFLKNYSQGAKWFVWNLQCRMLLLCAALSGCSATFQPYTFDKGQATKLPKFEVELSSDTSKTPGDPSEGDILNERDVCVSLIYDSPTVLVLKHPASTNSNAQLDVYSMSKDSTFKKSHVCLLELTGKFAVNIIDSVIVVHHQASQCSLMFDIKSGRRISPGFLSVYPMTLPKSIQPFELEDPEPVPSVVTVSRSIPCQLYASTWAVFQPNIIIDACLGLMWELHLILAPLVELVEDKVKLVEFLLRRNNAKSLILSVLKEEIQNGKISSLGLIFDVINNCYRKHLNSVLQTQMGDAVLGPMVKSEAASGCVVLDQAEIYSSVFAPIMEEITKNEQKLVTEAKRLNYKLMIAVVLDYIRSLNQAGVSIPSYISELVINGLVTTRKFFQLHQLLQYQVLPDSKPLACLLLSLVGVYPGAEQLSLDILSRLNTGHDEIIEILLSHNMVVEAIRYSKNAGQDDSLSARKFLEVAMTSEDPLIFYSTFKFFTNRNMSLRGKASFAKGEYCDKYVKHFEQLFGVSEQNGPDQLLE